MFYVHLFLEAMYIKKKPFLPPHKSGNQSRKPFASPWRCVGQNQALQLGVSPGGNID